MPFTFIVAPVLLVLLSFILIETYNDRIAEKEYIVSLSCPELKEYAEIQVIESKLYFGNEVYLNFAEERYRTLC